MYIPGPFSIISGYAYTSGKAAEVLAKAQMKSVRETERTNNTLQARRSNEIGEGNRTHQ